MLAAAAEGTRELLAFLRLIDTEGVQLAEVKLVLVGEGAVGKSSFSCSSPRQRSTWWYADLGKNPRSAWSSSGWR
ncbi:MAG: hypothetical protein ACRDRW_15425 [Pseudonocardiaceae bacterium]